MRAEDCGCRGGAVVLGLVVCVGLGAVLGGCAGAGRGGSGGAPGDAYIDQYRHGQFALAKAGAEAKMGSSSGLAHDQAELVAGLSAQAAGQRVEAKRLLRPLVDHRDAELAGRASAALGLIAQEEGDKAGAAEMLSRAASKLTGDEAAKAAMFAGDALTGLGKKDGAMAQYGAGQRAATSEALKFELKERLEGRRYTVQLGAFSTYGNADKTASKVRGQARAAGVGEPRILPDTARGKKVYTVQVGEFVSRQEAMAVKTRLGLEGHVTRMEKN